jgi:hypothetical protein
MSGSPVRDPGGLTVKDGALIGAGMLTVSGAALFYKQKKTLPFKVAYFLSWPLLGAAVIQVFGARRKDLEQVSVVVDTCWQFKVSCTMIFVLMKLTGSVIPAILIFRVLFSIVLRNYLKMLIIVVK